MENQYTFTFTFTGDRAQEVSERFAAYFWDGGLDQYLEQEFLADFGLDCDSFKFLAKSHVEVDTTPPAEE